jgi:hypothetical protein
LAVFQNNWLLSHILTFLLVFVNNLLYFIPAQAGPTSHRDKETPMKRFIATLFATLLLWPTLQASTEISRGVTQTLVQIVKIDDEEVIFYLQSDQKIDKLILDGYQQIYMAPDSPWPLPDTTKHP